MPTYCDCENPELIEDGSTSICAGCGDIVRDDPSKPDIEYCVCETPTVANLTHGGKAVCDSCCGIIRDNPPKPGQGTCPNCDSNDIITQGTKWWCQKCGYGTMLKFNPQSDHPEARIKELEQELADVNCQCRIAEGKIGVQSQMLKEAEDVACNAVGDLETAENRVRELEQKLGKAEESCRDLVDSLADAENRATTDLPGDPDPSASTSTKPPSTCPKCNGTAYVEKHYRTNCVKASTYRSLEVHKTCAILACPEYEHMHFICCRCGYIHWQHCKDHVTPHGHKINDASQMKDTEPPYPPDSDIQNDSASTLVKSPSICIACGEKFTFYAMTQSSNRGFCSNCWTKQMKATSEQGEQP